MQGVYDVTMKRKKMDFASEYNIKYRWKLSKGTKTKFPNTENVGTAEEYEKIFGPPPPSGRVTRKRPIREKSRIRRKLFGESSSVNGSAALANGRFEKIYPRQTFCENAGVSPTFDEAGMRTLASKKAKGNLSRNENLLNLSDSSNDSDY